jgi:hypothetical protein
LVLPVLFFREIIHLFVRYSFFADPVSDSSVVISLSERALNSGGSGWVLFVVVLSDAKLELTPVMDMIAMLREPR